MISITKSIHMIVLYIPHGRCTVFKRIALWRHSMVDVECAHGSIEGRAAGGGTSAPLGAGDYFHVRTNAYDWIKI